MSTATTAQKPPPRPGAARTSGADFAGRRPGDRPIARDFALALWSATHREEFIGRFARLAHDLENIRARTASRLAPAAFATPSLRRQRNRMSSV
jgi:hypothetical protein